MFKTIFLLLFFVAINLNAQEANVFITEPIKTKGVLRASYPVKNGEFYATRLRRLFQRNSVFIEYYKNFELLASRKAPYKVNGSIANFEGLNLINNKAFGFLSDKTDKTRGLYAIELSSNLAEKGPGVFIVEDPIKRNRNTENSFNFLQSKNNKYICIYIDITLKDDLYHTYKYVVIDENLTAVNKGELQLKSLKEKTVLSNAYLSNKGVFYLGAKEYELDDRRRLIKTYNQLSGVHLYKSFEDQFFHHKLDLTSKLVTETSILELKNENVALSGMYKDVDNKKKNNDGINGVFYAEINFNKENPVKVSYEQFGKEFIMEGWSVRKKKSAFRRLEKNNDEPQLINYKLRDLIYDTLTDSFTGIAEQYYVEERTTADSRGYTTTMFVYYYNALIVYQIDKNGQISWTSKIPKVQVSTNDYGYYSSITYLKTANTLNILYNDNATNYLTEDTYKTTDLHAATTTGRRHTVTHCAVNLKDGSYSRKALGSLSAERGSLFIPRLSEANNINNKINVYFSGKRGGQFGTISF